MPNVDRPGRCAPAEGERLLIAAALQPGDRADAAWVRWRKDHTIESSHGRARAILPAASSVVSESAQGEDRQVLRQLRRRTAFDNLQRLSELGRALDVLAPVTDRVMVFKGVAMAAWVYAPGRRTMGDIDLVVPPERFAAAARAFVAEGWQVAERALDLDIARTATLEQDGRQIDLHRWMLYPRLTRVSEQGIWDRAVEREVSGRPVLSPGHADAFVVAILHGLTPKDAGAVRWPIDVAVLIESANGSDEFWDEVVESSAELGMGRLVASGAQFCVEEFGMPIPMAVIERLADQQLDRWLAIEWAARRRGVRRGSRVRWYVDMNRAMQLRPTPVGYAGLRWGKLVAGGGPGPIIANRWHRVMEAFADRRRHRSSW